jgi:hypothetical protein
MSDSPGDLLGRLRAHRTATFRFGIARETPALTMGGVRGVGVTDLERLETRVVEEGFPELLSRSVEIRRARNPVRLLALRALAARLRRNTHACESRYEREAAWFREEDRDEWVSQRSMGKPRTRPWLGDPTWMLQLMGAPGVADLPARAAGASCRFTVDARQAEPRLPGGVLNDDMIDATSAWVELRLCVTLGDDGTPKQVGLLLPPGGWGGEQVWVLLEFTGFGVSVEQADLWHEWRLLRDGRRG